MHPLRLTVCCGLLERIQNHLIFISALLSNDLNDVWYNRMVQLGTIGLLRQVFDGRLISRNGDLNWPSKSYVKKPFNYFLRGQDKAKCHAGNSETIWRPKFVMTLPKYGRILSDKCTIIDMIE